MLLKEYCKVRRDEETEVWDECVDIGAPYYNDGGECGYEDSKEDHYLFLVEKWILSLPVSHSNGYSVCVDVYHEIEKNWNDILKKMKKLGFEYSFLGNPEEEQDDETIALYVEDVFTTLSQGFYSFAHDFCILMGLQEDYEAKIAERYNSNKIQVVNVKEMPSIDDIYSIEISELNSDLSQGTGNVISRKYYVPALDIVCCCVDF